MHAKLTAILHAIKSPIFQDSESRHLLLPTCCDHVKLHLLAKEELKLCSDILGEIITFLHSTKLCNEANNIERDVYVLVEVLMQPLMQTLMSLERGILSTVTVRNSDCIRISEYPDISGYPLPTYIL